MDQSVLLIMVVALLAFMFWQTTRNKKRMASMEAERETWGTGTRVQTTSGFIGTIVERHGVEVVLESDSGAQSTWLFRAIASKAERPSAVEVVEEETSSDASSATTGIALNKSEPA